MISKRVYVFILLILALPAVFVSADEKNTTPRLEKTEMNVVKTPVLEKEEPLGSLPVQAPPSNLGETSVLEKASPLDNLHLDIKEKKRLKPSSNQGKKVRDSNGKIATMTEMKSPQKNKEPHLVKQGKLTREQMDFRPKDKTEYAF